MAYNKTNKFLETFCSLLLVFSFTPFPIYADTPLSITSGRGEPFVNPDHNGFYDLIVKNMFQRVGVEAKTILLPSERALINANTGIDDGNIARIKGIEKKYPNLVMVPEKIIDFDFVAFTINKQFKIKYWEDLEPYNVTFINGWKVFEKKVKRYKSLVRVKDAEQLFGLLDNNRADVVLYDRWSGLWCLKQNPGKKYYLQAPIASFELYLYINKMHKNLVPKLSRALREMKIDGTYKKIYGQSLNSLLN
ncbi:MAG: amino acid ABC transporter substrate-binding protein [Gammaproteobacteria bacterium]|nr:amino acid ABC transporter substrate-binding protein [Gammaproteobacteria bacterium]